MKTTIWGNNMKFKVGDKVRVRSLESMKKEFGVIDRWGGITNGFTIGMKKYCGNIYEISAVHADYYSLKNCSSYWFIDNMLEPVKAETNGEHFRKEIKKIRNIYPEYDIAVVNDKPVYCYDTSCKSCLFFKNCPDVFACTSEEGFKKWCAEPYEAQEDKPILDKVEHDYLAAVIAPKRIYDNVKYIKKFKDSDEYYIYINLAPFGEIYLPCFKEKDHMYDGMEPNQPYTLKELGLEKE